MSDFEQWQHFAKKVFESTKGKTLEAAATHRPEGQYFLSLFKLLNWDELVILSIAETLTGLNTKNCISQAPITSHFSKTKKLDQTIEAAFKKFSNEWLIELISAHLTSYDLGAFQIIADKNK